MKMVSCIVTTIEKLQTEDLLLTTQPGPLKTADNS